MKSIDNFESIIMTIKSNKNEDRGIINRSFCWSFVKLRYNLSGIISMGGSGQGG